MREKERIKKERKKERTSDARLKTKRKPVPLLREYVIKFEMITVNLASLYL